MLILDKRKAVEQMVALTARDAAPEEEEAAEASSRRSYEKVATYERRRAALAVAKPRERNPSRRRRVRPAGGVSTA